MLAFKFKNGEVIVPDRLPIKANYLVYTLSDPQEPEGHIRLAGFAKFSDAPNGSELATALKNRLNPHRQAYSHPFFESSSLERRWLGDLAFVGNAPVVRLFAFVPDVYPDRAKSVVRLLLRGGCCLKSICLSVKPITEEMTAAFVPKAQTFLEHAFTLWRDRLFFVVANLPQTQRQFSPSYSSELKYPWPYSVYQEDRLRITVARNGLEGIAAQKFLFDRVLDTLRKVVGEAPEKVTEQIL